MTWLEPTTGSNGETPAAEPRSTSSFASKPSTTNPWIVTLGIVGGLALLIGGIFLAVGGSNVSNYATNASASAAYGLTPSGDSGIGELVWGGSLLGLGVTTFLLLFTAMAVIWKLELTEKKPPVPDSV